MQYSGFISLNLLHVLSCAFPCYAELVRDLRAALADDIEDKTESEERDRQRVRKHSWFRV